MRDGRVALGIDIGGTKVALVLFDAESGVLAERKLMNRDYPDPATLLQAVARESKALTEERLDGSTVAGVGVGICELVGPSGEIESSTTIPWKRAELEGALSPIGPLMLEADVRAAARGEAALGAGRPFPSFGYVTIGTGISSTFVRDGEPWAGAHGAAQLLGSARIALPCPHCGRTFDVSLEDVASGAGIARRYRERSGVGVAGSGEVIDASNAGDLDADAVLSEAAGALGSFLALFVNLFDPHAMVIGGGLASAAAPFFQRVVETGRGMIWAPHVRSLPILVGELGGTAGAIGAAWSVLGRGASG